MKIVSIIPGAPLPSETAAQLRELADKIEASQVTEIVVCYLDGEQYVYITPSRLSQSAFMSGMMQARVYKTLFGD